MQSSVDPPMHSFPLPLPFLESLLQIAEYKGSWFYGSIGKIIDRNKQVFHIEFSFFRCSISLRQMEAILELFFSISKKIVNDMCTNNKKLQL